MTKSAKSPKSAEPTILDRVEAYYRRFVAFNNPNHAFVLSLWALHTWVFDASYTTPYIYVSSIDPGSGKTTLMETAKDVCRNAEISAGSTPAGIYRALVEETPTFILDEIDTIWNGAKNDDLRKVINSGYERSGRIRIFIEGESQNLSTYAPKMLGGIDNGYVPNTVLDRSIRIRLRKLNVDQLGELNIEPRNAKRLAKDGSREALQEALSQWANIETVAKLDDMMLPQSMGSGLSARQWEISEPLVEIATLFGRGDEAVKAIVAVFQGETNETPEVAMLRKLRDLFDDTGADKLPASEMAEVTGYTADRMGRILAQFDIRSRPMKFAGQVQRGYHRVEMEDVFTRMVD